MIRATRKRQFAPAVEPDSLLGIANELLEICVAAAAAKYPDLPEAQKAELQCLGLRVEWLRKDYLEGDPHQTPWGAARLPADAPTLDLTEMYHQLSDLPFDSTKETPVYVMQDCRGTKIPVYRLLAIEPADYNGKPCIRLVVRPVY